MESLFAHPKEPVERYSMHLQSEAALYFANFAIEKRSYDFAMRAKIWRSRSLSFDGAVLLTACQN